MSESLSHIHATFRAVAQLADEERIAWIQEDRWIQYPRAQRILERLGELLRYPQHDRMPCLVVYGATGMGKTRIIQKFLRDQRSAFDAERRRTRRPVVYIQMPPTPNERNLYDEILTSMGGIFADGAGAASLRHRIRFLARQIEVRMLVIDEIHSLLAGSYRDQRIILNAIRFLANDLRIPIVCLGTEEANQALMTDQQLADRFEAAELPAWVDDEAFSALVLSYQTVLPLRRPSDLGDPRVRQRILNLSEGILVRICRLIENAAIQAIRSGQESVDLSLLSGSLIAESLVSIADRHTRRVVGR